MTPTSLPVPTLPGNRPLQPGAQSILRRVRRLVAYKHTPSRPSTPAHPHQPAYATSSICMNYDRWTAGQLLPYSFVPKNSKEGELTPKETSDLLLLRRRRSSALGRALCTSTASKDLLSQTDRRISELIIRCPWSIRRQIEFPFGPKYPSQWSVHGTLVKDLAGTPPNPTSQNPISFFLLSTLPSLPSFFCISSSVLSLPSVSLDPALSHTATNT